MRKTRTTLLGLVGLVVFACLLLAGCAGVKPTASIPVPSTSVPSLTTGRPPEVNATLTKDRTVLVATATPALTKNVSVPVGIKLAISHPPRLSETAHLTVTVVSVFDAPNSEARIELPKGAVLLAGDLRWQGSLKANVLVQFLAAIKFVETGQKTITAVAKSIESATSSVSAVDEVVLDVAETSGQFHDFNPDPRTPRPVEWLPPGQTTPVIIYPDALPVLSGTQPTAMPRPIPATSEPTASLSHTTMSPTSVKLAISHPPRLGETAYLTVTVVSVFDAPNSEARLKLPKGAVLLGGDLRWQGSLKANVPVQFSAAIKFVETGQKTITAVAESIESATSSVGGVDEVVLDVAETSGQFHVYDPRTPQPIEKLVPGHAPVTVYPDAPPVLSGTQPPAIPVPSAVPTPTSDPPVQRSESVPIGIKLVIAHPPRLGETMHLTLR